jgi:chromosome segregation ATPase
MAFGEENDAIRASEGGDDATRLPQGDAPQDASLERGFVALLRWLVAEGDVRGVRRIAVELRALREALTTLDETRLARDEQTRRSNELDRELQAALAVLGPGTAVNGNGSLVQRLAKLRERLAADMAARKQLTLERDAWRSMCTLLTQTRAGVHELLESTERERDHLSTTLDVLRARVAELTTLHDDASNEATRTRTELAQLRDTLRHWSGTVERALLELAKSAGAIAREHRPPDPTRNS